MSLPVTCVLCFFRVLFWACSGILCWERLLCNVGIRGSIWGNPTLKGSQGFMGLKPIATKPVSSRPGLLYSNWKQETARLSLLFIMVRVSPCWLYSWCGWDLEWSFQEAFDCPSRRNTSVSVFPSGWQWDLTVRSLHPSTGGFPWHLRVAQAVDSECHWPLLDFRFNIIWVLTICSTF